MNYTLAFALVILSNGEIKESQTTYYTHLQDCRWYAQTLMQKTKFYKPVEEAYCTPAWVNKDKVKLITVKVISKTVTEEGEE